MMLIMLCKDRSRTRKVYDSDACRPGTGNFSKTHLSIALLHARYLSMSSMVSWGKAGAKFGILNSVAGSFCCPKRAVLDERLKSSEYSATAAIGTFFSE
ncbi:hypothetical protein LINPERPRIM_LOCUS42565 [Linum perenne]